MAKTKKKRLTETGIARRLVAVLDRVFKQRGANTSTFSEAGVLTSDKGVVLQLGNGQEFQITIVDSTRRGTSTY